MLRTFPPTNWSQISAEIPSSLVIMSQRVWDSGEGGIEEKGGGSQTSITEKVIKQFGQENCKPISVPLPTRYNLRSNPDKEANTTL